MAVAERGGLQPSHLCGSASHIEEEKSDDGMSMSTKSPKTQRETTPHPSSKDSLQPARHIQTFIYSALQRQAEDVTLLTLWPRMQFVG